LRFTTVGSNGGVVTETSLDQNQDLLVQAAVIDDVLPDQPITMVKIDIEAHEPFALRGMTKLLKKYRPKIVTEFHPVGDGGKQCRSARRILEAIGRLWIPIGSHRGSGSSDYEPS